MPRKPKTKPSANGSQLKPRAEPPPEQRAVAASCSLCGALAKIVMGDESAARAAARAEGWRLHTAFGLESLTCPKCAKPKREPTKKAGKKRRLPVVEGSG